jgi:HAE1 family hydrophobic/amphiphilic exporter-1
MSKKVVDHPILTIVVFALIGIVSIYSLTDIAIDQFPDIENPYLIVYSSYKSAGPESVEKSVTKVLESSLSGVSGLKSLSSTSSEETSLIELEFEYGTNLDSATNDVRDKIDRVEDSLPDGVSNPSIFKFSSSSMPVLRIAVRGNRTAEDLKEISEDYIVDRLQQATGVAQASVSGGRDKIVRVDISQNRLEAYDLTMTSVASALSLQNLELGGGKISDGTKNYIVRTVGEYPSIDAINDAIVANKNGYVVRLRDIGTAKLGFVDATSAVYINGQPGVYVSVTKQSGTNTVNVVDSAKKKLDEIRKVIPSDVTLEIMSDSSTEIRSTINSLISSALQGALLAMLILLMFLRNIKSTLIMGISIPFSIMLTLLCMKFAGITLNMMTMTGLILGVGMVVDASVVILENIYQYRERGTKPTVAAVLGSQEMFASVISGNLTTVCVFIPVIFFKSKLGMIGQMLPDVIFTIIIALLSSLFVALFLVPVLASKFLVIKTRVEKPLKNRFLILADKVVGGAIDSVTNAYRNAIRVVLSHRLATTLVVVGMFVLSLALVSRLNLVMMPNMGDESVTLNVSMPIGTRLEETQSVVSQFSSVVEEEIKGYKSIITSVGTGGHFGSQNSTYTGSIQIQLPDANSQIDTSDTIKTKLRKHFNDYPSATFDFSAGFMRQMNGADIDITIRGDDLDSDLATAKKIVSIMKAKVPDVSEASIDMTEGLPQVEISIDRDRAYAFGVNVKAVANEINACVEGVTATVYRQNGKEYNVTLMLQNSDRSKVPDLEKIYVNGNSGRVAVSNFATLTKGVGPVSIKRENQTRIIHVTADILTNARANIVEQKIQKAVEDSIIVPEGVTVSYEGSWNDIMSTLKIFILIITMALLLVYGVMAGTYESFKDPFINMFTIPFGIIGVVLIYLFTGQNLSMFTAFGFVMLVGIAVNNGIILVDQTNLLVSRGVAVREACITAAQSRLRPILMTTLTTLLGMFPMAFLPAENSKMLQPIGLSIFGGLASSTLITLFFIPVLYSLLNEKRGKKREVATKESN